MKPKAPFFYGELQKSSAAFLARVIRVVKSMTSEDHRKAMIKAGILTKSGKLTAAYRTPTVRRPPGG